jgi:hypothetical protein
MPIDYQSQVSYFGGIDELFCMAKENVDLCLGNVHLIKFRSSEIISSPEAIS